jgi:hypothetical protein
LTLLLHVQHWFPTFFSLHSLMTRLQVFHCLIFEFVKEFFCSNSPKKQYQKEMKDQIAQRNKTTRKKMTIDVACGWHQTFGKCIVGVAFIFTSKISSKMKLDVTNSRF